MKRFQIVQDKSILVELKKWEVEIVVSHSIQQRCTLFACIKFDRSRSSPSLKGPLPLALPPYTVFKSYPPSKLTVIHQPCFTATPELVFTLFANIQQASPSHGLHYFFYFFLNWKMTAGRLGLKSPGRSGNGPNLPTACPSLLTVLCETTYMHLTFSISYTKYIS